MNPRAFGLWLADLPRPAKRGVMLVTDCIALAVLAYVAFGIRLGSLDPAMSGGRPLLLWLIPAATLPILYALGFYRAVVRCQGSERVSIVLIAATVAALIASATLFVTEIPGVPRSVVFIVWALSLLYLGGSRFVVRRYLLWALNGLAGRVPVAIYGAGGCGMQLAFALSQASRYLPKLFVDDNPTLQGTTVQGLPVVARESLAKWLKKRDVHTVVLALPSVSRHQRRVIFDFLKPLGVEVKSVPALPDVIAGTARVEDVHDVEVEDLLGRDAVPPKMALLRAPVTGRSVMVTGAGGSIGSELCRQIMALEPTRLVLFERGEFELYKIDQELRRHVRECGAPIELVPMLGSVTCRSHVEAVCRQYGIQTLFHAAAYKHVPIVEAHPVAGVENNIFGTLNTALAAEAAGVERFVFISTDKAVRPTNVMGATKRFSEMVLQALADRGSKTIFTMVRFGNVLGSSGSVVPLFRKQILAGGPVTLTHRDITRFFMTIPEAAQLVIQAGAMAHGGEVFLLDMGKPVKIFHLARSLIHLMGYSVRDEQNPDGDIEIRETGLRPGEKLYEELLIGEDSIGTGHPMIMQAREMRLPWAKVKDILARMDTALDARDASALLALLRQHVNGYHPAAATPADDKVNPTDKVVTLDSRRTQRAVAIPN